eukprot:403333658
MSDQFDNGSYFKTITDESEDGSANKANSFTKSSYPQLSSRYNFVTPNLKALDLKKDLQQPKVNTIQTEKKPINPTALSVFRRKRSQENLLITESRDNFQNTSTSVSNNISQQLNRNNVQMSKSQSNIFAQMSPKQQMLFTSYLNNANINSHQQNQTYQQNITTSQSRTSMQDTLRMNNQSALSVGFGNKIIMENSMSKNKAINFNEASIMSSDMRQLTQQSNQFDSSRVNYNQNQNNQHFNFRKPIQQNETAKFRLRSNGGASNNSGSPSPYRVNVTTSHYIGDGTPNKTSSQLFDSSTQGFPYMKKKHMHKASDIQQHIDEPVDNDFNQDSRQNEKGTYTEEEYLNLNSKEKTIVFTVMEDLILKQDNKISRLKKGYAELQEQKMEYETHLKRVVGINQNLYEALAQIQSQLQESTKYQDQTQIMNLLRENEQIVVKCIKYQLDCLSFFKDIVTMNRDNDGRQLKMKLDKYLHTEGTKLNANLFKQDYLEKKLAEIQTMIEDFNTKSLTGILKNMEIPQQKLYTFLNESYSINQLYNSSSQNLNTFEQKEKQKQKSLLQKLESESKLYQKKIRDHERLIQSLTQNQDKKGVQIQKDIDVMKGMLQKLQNQNIKIKNQLKSLNLGVNDSMNTSLQSVSRKNISDMTSMILSKIKKAYKKTKDQFIIHSKDLKQSIKTHKPFQNSNHLIQQITQNAKLSGKLELIVDNFKQDLGSQLLNEVEDVIVYKQQLESQIEHLDLDFDRKFDSSNKKIKSAEKDNSELLIKISQQEDELQFLRDATTDVNIQRTFQQISIILLQGISSDSSSNLNDQQRQLIQTLFGNQVSTVMQDFRMKLQDYEIQNKLLTNQLLQEKKNHISQVSASLGYLNDLIDIISNMKSLKSNEIIQKYQDQRKDIDSLILSLNEEIQNLENQNILGNDVAINEIGRKLSMIDENSLFLDQSVDLKSNLALRRSGSQGGNKTRRYKDKIATLESKLELMQLENMSLQNDLKKQFSGIKHMNSVLDSDGVQEFNLNPKKLMKSNSEQKFQAIINFQQRKNTTKTQNGGRQISQILSQVENSDLISMIDQDRSPLKLFNQAHTQKQSLHPVESRSESQYYESNMNFTPFEDRTSIAFDINDRQESKLSQVLGLSNPQIMRGRVEQNILVNSQIDEIVKDYEDQAYLLQSFIHNQALYIEEVLLNPYSHLTNQANIDKFSHVQTSQDNPSNLSMNSGVSIIRNQRAPGAHKRFSRLGKASAETSKSKSVTRYQNIEDDKIEHGDM